MHLSSLIFNPMASATSSPSPSSPPSPSYSGNSATQPTPRTSSHHQGSAKDAATNNGVRDALEKKPHSVDPFEDMNGNEYNERFSNYEADYTRRLMAKYFSDKDIYGGNIFDESMAIDGKTIKASRFHCALSYADPVQFLREKSAYSSASSANIPTSISNGKHSTKEDG